jgi:uncharacterized protein (DUF1800 family)
VSGPAAAAGRSSDDFTIVHALNRVGFGPRAGDVERIRAIGLDAYVDEQLRPDKIADGSMDDRLVDLTTLRLTSREIADRFERPAIEAQRARREAQAAGRGDASEGMSDPVQQRANRVLGELAEQKILRAVYSERQLQEVMTDFWFNHFNVDARKGPARFMLTEYERDVIRPHVLGRFRDLLDATAKSPAMLFYLDNWMSVDPNGPHPVAPPARVVRRPFGPPRVVQAPPTIPQQRPNAPKGLNENYARELMELHTLGVDGGYGQKDVTEVARAFTGWTIQNPRQGGGFVFNPRFHDQGRKTVLGHEIKAGRGIEDGEQVLDLLAEHPSTARFIATKLVRRFVSDTPPPALVDRAATRFQKTGGDIREVVRLILTSPEFLAPDSVGAKVKTPFEFVASALRATGARVDAAPPLVRTLQQLGMPLYQCQPPTGYKDTADAWTNTGALVARMNFALSLTDGKLRGVAVDPALQPPDADRAIAVFLNGSASDATRRTIAQAASAPAMAALTLGSPEFQRR